MDSVGLFWYKRGLPLAEGEAPWVRTGIAVALDGEGLLNPVWHSGSSREGNFLLANLGEKKRARVPPPMGGTCPAWGTPPLLISYKRGVGLGCRTASRLLLTTGKIER